jgi:2-haloacid dehalogenase
MPNVKGFIFDAYGTLFDVHSVVEACREITRDPEALSREWRQKQLEYTWLRALMGRYEDFWKVTEAALRFAARRQGLQAADEQLRRAMDAYLSLSCFPEVNETLGQLAPLPLAVLSNGSPAMLEAAVRSSGLTARFSHVLSVDEVRTYKPAPVVYALGPKALGLSPDQILYVSGNAWDMAGAKAFGYRVCWCNRANAQIEELGMTPDLVVSRLDEIPGRLRE